MSTFKTAPAVGRKNNEGGRTMQLELTYITERIIGMLFPSGEQETIYRSSIYDVGLMLKSKHGSNYMVINLSERRDDLNKILNQILEFGWPESLAPSLERLCSICKLIDQWLNADPKNVVVIHCKGGLGRMGVALSAYVDYCNVCASADQALDQFAMKHFCDTKLGAHTQPSQRRYARYFAGLLSGSIRVNSRPLFLYKIRIHGLPSFAGRNNYCIFIKIYQTMIPVYVSSIYASSSTPSMFIVSLEPCLQLRGDVLLKCFCKSLVSQSSSDILAFQCQFHTCAVLGDQLKFGKGDLDREFPEMPFSEDGQLELFFAESPDDIYQYDTVDERSLLIDVSPSHFDRQWNSYEDLSSLADQSPTLTSGLTCYNLAYSMQRSNGSLQANYYMPGNGMKTGMQLNQSHIKRGSNDFNDSFQKKGNKTGLSPYTDYPVSENSSTSTDGVNLMMSCTSKFSQKGSPEDVPLDDILQEILAEQKLLDSSKAFADSKRHLASQYPVHGSGSVNGNVGGSSWQHRNELEPGQITKGTVSWSKIQRLPQETDFNQRGLSKPCMWSNGEPKTEAIKKEQSFIFESPGQRLVKMLDQELPKSVPHTQLRSSDQPSRAKEIQRFNASGLNGTAQRSHNTLTQSKSYGYRNCASDTEDQMSWLEEQRSKLQNKREGAILKQRSQQEKRLISELKTAQNTMRSSKRSQSDTEEISPDGRNDFQAHLQNIRTVNQFHENIGTGAELGFRDQTKNPNSETKLNGGQHLTIEGYSQFTENKTLMLQRNRQLANEQSQTMMRSGQKSFDSSMSNDFVSPATPVRGESSRQTVVKHACESNSQNGQDSTNLDELERSLKLTLQSMSKSKISDRESSPGYNSTKTRSVQYQKENSSPVTAWSKLQTPSPHETEEEEVIELKPIGQGVRILEPGSNLQMSSSSYPVQVVVSPFPLSPVSSYDNNGLATVRRGITSSASVPLSLSSSIINSDNSVMSPTSTISERGDNITFDLQQQQQLIKQQLLQQQVKQQQLQQQLQQLYQLQQQHQFINQKLQEHRQQQQLMQQQQQQVEPHTHYQSMQQQQMLEQQLLQQQQQLLLLQQQLKQQQQVQQLEGEPRQRAEQQEHFISETNKPYQNGSSVLSFMQKTITQNQGLQLQTNFSNSPESEERKDTQNPLQTLRSENYNAGLLQNSIQKASIFEQQQLQQPNGLTAGKEPSVQRHQTLGRTLSAQQATSYTRQQPEFIHSSSHHPTNIQQHQMQLQQQQLHLQQQQLQLQQHQLSPHHQQHKLEQQMAAATARSPGHAVGRGMAEDVIQKVHTVVCGGDRGIPPLETVFGLREKKQTQSPFTTQQSAKEVTEGLTIDTATSFQALLKSPSAPANSSRSLQSPNQIVRSPRVHDTLQRTLSGPGSPNSGGSRAESTTSQDLTDGLYQTPRFVRDNSQSWHKPNLTRDEVIVFLKDRPAGSFIIRNSTTFQGAFGLAIKVAQIPPNIQPRSEDLEIELVRHFLIESTPKGVRLKGSSNEPVFGSLAALVYQHSITPLSLPCKLILPELGEVSVGDTIVAKSPGPVHNEGLITASNVLYISSTDLESLTGPEAVSRAIERTFNSDKPTIAEVHFKVTSVGITLTDNKRRLFFRRHYPFNTITHCGLDAKDQRWTVKDENDKSISTGRVFGFVARKLGSSTENSCHLFGELDSTQSASSIISAITKVLISGDLSAKS